MPPLQAGNDAGKGTINAPQRICSHSKRLLQGTKRHDENNALVLMMVGNTGRVVAEEGKVNSLRI